MKLLVAVVLFAVRVRLEDTTIVEDGRDAGGNQVLDIMNRLLLVIHTAQKELLAGYGFLTRGSGINTHNG